MILMKKTVIVEAPGKINLSFDITGKRADGYHNVDTIMQTIDLCDTVTISRMDQKGIFISCDRPRIPCDETNFAHIAAQKFFAEFGQPDTGISIDIQKRLPVQAGLAGGSADAAAVLMGLNVFFDVNEDLFRLCRLGAEVGADVPFCLMGGTQRATGIGERLVEVEELPRCQILIAKPPAGISTKEAYARYDERGRENHPDIEYLLKQLRMDNLKDFSASMYNVLEEVAYLPEIPAIKRKMISCGALGALMSGSGSAVFGIFDSRSRAKHCMRKLYDMSEAVFLARPAPHGAVVLDVRE